MTHLLKINRIEKYLLFATSIAMLIIFYRFNMLRFFSLGTDSAGYIDLIRAVSQNGTMVSPIFSSFYSIMPLLATTSDIYCASALASANRVSDFLQWHPYFISYALAVPVKYLGISALEISSFINSFNIVASISLIYLYSRQKGLSIIETVAFVFAVAISDYWVGSLTGQLYYDRLFLFPCLIIILICFQKWHGDYLKWLIICIAAFSIAISISERTALLVSVVTLGYWALLKDHRFDKYNLTLFVLGIAGLVYFFVYIRFFQNSIYYVSINLQTILHNLNLALSPSGVLFDKTITWFTIVSPMLMLSFVNWRFGILALASMLPNLMVTVGGAEKTGFTTHYHAGYIPFLVGFAAVGYSSLINKIRIRFSAEGTNFKSLIFCMLALLAVVTSTTIFSNYKDSRGQYVAIFGAKDNIQGMVKTKADFSEFLSNIPADEWLSAPELTMPTLAASGKNNIDYMPIGLGANKYVIASYISPTKHPEITSYLDLNNKQEISECIQKKLDDWYSSKFEKKINGVLYVIYERKL